MAEVMATMVVGPLLSMVKDKASSYLLDQYKVMEGMEEQHKLLKRKLPAILDVIADAEEQAAKHREGAKAWLEDVRKVAYKANDVLDEFKYEALRRKAKEDGQYYKALGMNVNRLVFRRRMSNKLRSILHEIDVLITEMNCFRFRFKPQLPMSAQWRQTDAFTPKDSVEIASKSRAQEKKDLIDRLLSQASTEDITVFPIVGMGGLGKTTLAQLVYNDPEIQKHFELRVWVCASDDFNVDSLADKIVNENGCGSSGSSALDRLQNAVNGKRYLLVLDDVWNRDEHKWEKLKSYLQHGASGSSVLTTTRDQAVARLMMDRSTTDVQNLKMLDPIYIKEIIGTRAFGSKQEDKWPRELVGMVGDMVKRCSGSPLAATALGSMLRTKTRKQEWKDVLSKSTICDEENGILPVLKMSYNGLPSHMRQCFAFCAMFPKDYEINVEKLIQLWMANGFIPEKQGERPEIIGTNIFLELASRSFFQDVKRNSFLFNTTALGITCKIHDLMHDVAGDSMGDQCANIATELSTNVDLSYSARHLFLSVHRPETFLNASLEKGSPAFQTLICDRIVEDDVKTLSNYNSIRALKIKQGSFLIRPKYLHHLRYLDLSESGIEELPEDISILYHLQTLNLSYCGNLERLPKELKYLTALRHLYTHGCNNLNSMPSGLGHLTQTLTWFVAGTDSGCSNVGELQKLDLGGRLELRQLENVTGADAQAASLQNKEKLIELELSWTYSSYDAQNNHKEVVECLNPHDGLKVLRICYCRSSTFPKWLNTLRGMVELVLYGCRMLEKLPTLWQLPALQILRLGGLRSLHCLCSDGKSDVTFPELKVLTLSNMPAFKAWWHTDEVQGEQPAFPKVEELNISDCRNLSGLPKAASVIMESSVGVDTNKCRSAFPALRKMELCNLDTFHKWEAVEGTVGEEVTFPCLEELSITSCRSLSALPKGPLLVKQSFGEVDTKCRCAFPALRKMDLHNLHMFDKWEGVEATVGEEVMFPCLDELSIKSCRSLSALTKGPLLAKHSFGKTETLCTSAFPALRKLILYDLWALEKLVAVDGTQGEEVTFPLLEELSIKYCGNLRALPKGSLVKQSFGGAETMCRRSAFPSLRKLDLLGLSSLGRWGAVEGTPGVEVTLFPLLEVLTIDRCPTLTDLPEAPKLSILSIEGEEHGQQISLQTTSYIPSLSSLTLDRSTLLLAKHKLNHKLPLAVMILRRCDALFSSHPSALALWACCAQLVDLRISGCNALVYWPKNVFQVLASLRKLSIFWCSKLKVHSQASDEQSAPAPEQGGLPPHLDYLRIDECASLVEVPNLPASLKTLYIERCGDLKSIVFCQQDDTRLVSEVGVWPDTSSLIQGSSSLEARASTAVPELSSAANHRLLPCLESLTIRCCDGLSEVANLPPSIKTLDIQWCSELRSLSGQLDGVQKATIRSCSRLETLGSCLGKLRSLEKLELSGCKSLLSLPDGPQAYSSLRSLRIEHCDSIKLLPRSLQSRLDYLEEKHLCPHYKEPTWKHAIRRLGCSK